jgi:UDP-N-acetylmuramate: L-alanyl-gamma-D-glutamyl-meso-diaminopimelate ligase
MTAAMPLTERISSLKTSQREHLHLLGIGGTGMTALAGLLQESGCRVTGSDKELYPPTSTILERLGVEVYTGFDPAHLDPEPDLVVVGNAISRGNPEVEEVLDRGLSYVSMPQLIARRFLAGRHSMVVSGTHGKTTTSSILARVLAGAGRDPGFLIGGAPLDFDLPFRVGTGEAFVIEGDEYDTAFFDKGPKFMHYRPDTALLGTVEFDHADIFRDLDEVKTVFRRLINLIPRRGLLVCHEDSPVVREMARKAFCRVEGYGFDRGRWRAVEMEEAEAGARFHVLRDEQRFVDVSLRVPGAHNVLNALAVVAAAADRGLSPDEIKSGLESFHGVRRRLEPKGEIGGIEVFDDFAHHPTAITNTLHAVRLRFAGRRIWAVVEPRSWSMRKNVFQQLLAEAFDDADQVLIAGVFGRTAIAEGDRLDTDRLVCDLSARGRVAESVPDVDGILERLVRSTVAGDVIVVMSNGGFDGLVGRLVEALQARQTAAS